MTTMNNDEKTLMPNSDANQNDTKPSVLPTDDASAAHARAIQDAFNLKDAALFSGTTGKDSRWPRVMVVNTEPIPLTHDKFTSHKNLSKDGKSLLINLVMVNGSTRGFCTVPVAASGSGKYTTGENAKPLSVVCPCERLGGEAGGFSAIQCYPWTIVEGCPQDKDDRVEEAGWVLEPGMVFKFNIWGDSMRGSPEVNSKASKISVTPDNLDVIPAFSVLDVEISIKGWSKWNVGDEYTLPNGKKKTVTEICPVKKGYGIGIGQISVSRGSIYSCVDKVSRCIGSSHLASNALQKELIDRYPGIAQSQQGVHSPFYVKALDAETSFAIDVQNGLVKVFQWAPGMEDPIDIEIQDALRYTNSLTVEDACSVMEVACQMGGMGMFCMHNRYRKNRKDEDPVYSEFHGVPLLSAATLLECVGRQGAPLVPSAEDPRFYEFVSDKVCTNMSPGPACGREFRPKLLVSCEPFYNLPLVQPDKQASVAPPLDPSVSGVPCADLALVGMGFQLSKAYFVRFVNSLTGEKMASVYFNLAKPSLLMASSCGNVLNGTGSRLLRKRWSDGLAGSSSSSLPGSKAAKLAGSLRARCTHERDPWELLAGSVADVLPPSPPAEKPAPPSFDRAKSTVQQGEDDEDDDEEEDEDEEEEEEEVHSKAAAAGKQGGKSAGKQMGAPPAAAPSKSKSQQQGGGGKR